MNARWLAIPAALVALAPATASAKSKWGNHVFVRPSAGGNVFTAENGESISVFTVGGRAGINYWEKGRKLPKLRGQARVAGDYVMSSGDISGYEARIGNFMGPTWGIIGFTVGPDFFYNQYQYGSTVLPATSGMGVPFIVDANLDVFSVFGGIEPAWYFNDVRERRDWQAQEGPPGFGHEMAYILGAGLNVGGWDLGLSWRYSMTAYGEQSSYGVNARFDGAIGGGGKKKKGKKKGRGRF